MRQYHIFEKNQKHKSGINFNNHWFVYIKNVELSKRMLSCGNKKI